MVSVEVCPIVANMFPMLARARCCLVCVFVKGICSLERDSALAC